MMILSFFHKLLLSQDKIFFSWINIVTIEILSIKILHFLRQWLDPSQNNCMLKRTQVKDCDNITLNNILYKI